MSNVGAEKTWLKWINTNEQKPSREDADRNDKVIAVYKPYGEEAKTEAVYYDEVRAYPSLHPYWAAIPEALTGYYSEIPDGATMLEWIPAIDRLPTAEDTSDHSKFGDIMIRRRHSMYGVWAYESMFNSVYQMELWDPEAYAWLPFPQPPKEVE